MKKLTFLFLALAVSASCAGKDAVITGKLTGADGKKVYLFLPEAGASAFDSTVVKNGTFTMTVKKYELGMAGINLEGGSSVKYFIIEPGKISVTGDLSDRTKATVSGTKSNDLFNTYNVYMDSVRTVMNTFGQEAMSILEADPSKQDSLLAIYQQMADRVDAHMANLIKENSDNVFGACAADSHFGHITDYDKLDSLIGTLKGDATNNSFYNDLVKNRDAIKNSRIGAVAPDFTLPTPDGGAISLSSLRGQYVMIDFWASWCGPCRGENPHVVEMYNKYKDKGFTILGVSFDTNKDRWLEAIEADGLTWLHCSDLKGWECAAGQLYTVQGIPHTVLVDPQGIIIAKNLRGESLTAKLAELFGE